MGESNGRHRLIEAVRLPHAEGLPKPFYAKAGDAGMDLIAAVTQPVPIGPGERALIPTGWKVALPGAHELQIRSRSGLALKEGIMVLNSPGTIDEGYRGEVQVILFNTTKDWIKVERGMRVAQAVLAPVVRGEWKEVDSIPDSERGANGFGSTGA
jgi:dUTP pyrophosphatase